MASAWISFGLEVYNGLKGLFGFQTDPSTSEMLQALADWIIVDSGGSAGVVFNRSTDSPSARAYAEDAQRRFAEQCPGCTVAMNDVSTANFPLIPSATSSAATA